MNNAVEAIQEWARSVPAIRQVWLFGSRVSGAARPDSDLDMAVSLEGGAPLSTFVRNAAFWRAELSRKVKLRIDLQVADPEESPLVWSYLQRGSRLVYDLSAEPVGGLGA